MSAVLYCSTCKRFHAGPCKRRRSSGGGSLSGFPRAVVGGLAGGWFAAVVVSAALRQQSPELAVGVIACVTVARLVFYFATRKPTVAKAAPAVVDAPALPLTPPLSPAGEREEVEPPSTLGASIASLIVGGALLAVLGDLIVFGRLLNETPSEFEAASLAWVGLALSAAWSLGVLVWTRRARLLEGVSAAGPTLLVAMACGAWHVGGEERDYLVLEARQSAGRNVYYGAETFLGRYPRSSRRSSVLLERLLPHLAATLDRPRPFRTSDWNLELFELDAHPGELSTDAAYVDQSLGEALANVTPEEARAIEAAVKDAREAGPLLSWLARQRGDPVLAQEAVRRVERAAELRSSAPRAERRKKAPRGALAIALARLDPERRIDVVVELGVPRPTAVALASSAAYALRHGTGLLFRAGVTGSAPSLHLRGGERVETLELVGAEPSPGPIALPGPACAVTDGACLERAIFAALDL